MMETGELYSITFHPRHTWDCTATPKRDANIDTYEYFCSDPSIYIFTTLMTLLNGFLTSI